MKIVLAELFAEAIEYDAPFDVVSAALGALSRTYPGAKASVASALVLAKRGEWVSNRSGIQVQFRVGREQWLAVALPEGDSVKVALRDRKCRPQQMLTVSSTGTAVSAEVSRLP